MKVEPSRNINKIHRCKDMPININMFQIYSPSEISWEFCIGIISELNSVRLNIKKNIKYCPYCGEKLSMDFN